MTSMSRGQRLALLSKEKQYTNNSYVDQWLQGQPHTQVTYISDFLLCVAIVSQQFWNTMC